jgi:predicted DNA repair protein MutK
VVTIGLSLTIPLALVASLFIPSSSADAITPLSLIGAVLVFLAFAILGMQGLAESQGEVEPDLIEERIEESEAEPTRGRTTA